VRADVQRAFNDWLQGRMAHTVWQTGGCRSWYQDPRSGRNTVLWPDTAISFWRRLRRVRMSDYLLQRTSAGSEFKSLAAHPASSAAMLSSSPAGQPSQRSDSR
jgi:hypothetical protein